MRDPRLISALRAHAQHGATPLELAFLLGRMHEDGLSASLVVSHVKGAFPHVPLGTLIEATSWHRISSCDMTDREFDRILSPHFSVWPRRGSR